MQALDGAHLRVARGEVVGVVGREGSGKSTLLSCAAGLVRPDAGRIRWPGAIRSRGGLPRGVMLVRPVGAFRWLTVRESVQLAALRCPVGVEDSGVDAALARIDMGAVGHQRVDELAPDDQVLLPLAELVLAPLTLALIDGVWPRAEGAAMRIAHRLVRQLADAGTGVLIAARSPDRVLAIADRVVWIDAGRVESASTSGGLREASVLELDVDRPAIAAARLRNDLVAEPSPGGTLRITLGTSTPESVLARCRALDIAVHGSRVLAG